MALRAHVRLWDTDLAELQAKSRELVVFSRELGGLVIVFWPTVNVVRLEADEVVKLVQQEKLHWPCFFSRLEGRPLPCHILMVGDGVSAYCHYAPVARCSFFLSLSPINVRLQYLLTRFTEPPNSHSNTRAPFSYIPRIQKGSSQASSSVEMRIRRCIHSMGRFSMQGILVTMIQTFVNEARRRYSSLILLNAQLLIIVCVQL
ncbi:hypothetical protein R3P38DRAFT_2803627 [Favolaschia claudopus]|uniref:Uncharacterized protein n=1 Tax=Favolaschia claudopus TaxID=2862362 RepID=A0AAV9ZRW5_9AGAR